MLSSLYSGISGLLTNSESINVIGNNISNVNTVGYKSQRASFQDMLYQSIESAAGSAQVGRGAVLASVDTSFSQGSFESTSSATDLAIGGIGFFMVKDAATSTTYYTRAGGFSFDANGFLTNSAGLRLQGKVIDRITNTASGVDTDINISSEPSQPKATGQIGMALNLQSTAPWTGNVTGLASGGVPVTAVSASASQYPTIGDYTVTTVKAPSGLTGAGAVSIPLPGGMAGTLIINGTSINLATANGGGPVTTVAQLATAISSAGITGVSATPSVVPVGTNLTISGTAGTDITVDDSGVTAGGIGWTTADKASTSLYGATMTLTLIGGGSPSPWTSNVRQAGGLLKNFMNSGLDVNTGPVTAAVGSPSSQAFTLKGFDNTSIATASATSNYSTSVTAYDSLGQSHVVNFYFRKMGPATTPGQTKWEWHAMLSAADTGTVDKEVGKPGGTLQFNDSGTLVSGGDKMTLGFDFRGASPGQQIGIVLGPNSGGGTTTQYPIASTTNFQTQDGYAPGTLTSVSVSTDGTIAGKYSNGQILNLYQVRLASFSDPQGLEREGGNLYSQTVTSGVPYMNTPGAGGLGNINSNSLEQSNVDLATEFVKMIVAQRGYQANSKVITTTDQMLQELMQIKQ